MVHYKLIYFDARGTGEISRRILAYANIPFENVRVTIDEWPSLKPTMPFGHLPVLEVDGKPLAQSFAIARFLARQHGLAGKDDWEASQIDAIADFTKETHEAFKNYFMASMGWSDGNKDEIFEKEFKPIVEKNFPIFEKLLKKSESGFFGKSGVSWVDFYVSSLVETCKNLHLEMMEKYEELLKHKERIYAMPKLKKYFETAPKTSF